MKENIFLYILINNLEDILYNLKKKKRRNKIKYYESRELFDDVKKNIFQYIKFNINNYNEREEIDYGFHRSIKIYVYNNIDNNDNEYSIDIKILEGFLYGIIFIHSGLDLIRLMEKIEIFKDIFNIYYYNI